MLPKDTKKLLNWALILSFITVFYNLAEGIVSLYFGAHDAALALLGFGTDSFVEVVSGLGIAHMVWRMKQRPKDSNVRDRFEQQALKITGTGFYVLTAGLVIGAVFKIITHSVPNNTRAGLIISVLSIGSMYLLMHYKLKVGHKLASNAILADANCTKTCLYLSCILLASSAVYAIWQLPYVDAIGSLGIAWFAFSEGGESWEKARTDTTDCPC